jgi:hypothetical protein
VKREEIYWGLNLGLVDNENLNCEKKRVE